MSTPKPVPSRIHFVNVSNPAAFGVEWTAETNRFTLVNPRGTTALWFGAYHDGRWWRMDVVDPSRFGLTDPPTSFPEFMAIVRVYVQA
jgi:hypothetical protein